MPLLHLPNEILLQIAHHLDPPSFTNTLLLSSFFHRLLTPPLHHLAFSTPRENLFWAARRGHHHLARLLLSHGTPPEFSLPPRGMTPLHEAAYRGHLEVVKVLLEYGADLHSKDYLEEGTALHHAAACSHVDVVEYLLEHGAHGEVNTSGLRSVAPLIWAIKCMEHAFMLELEKVNSECTAELYYGLEGDIEHLFSSGQATDIKNTIIARTYKTVQVLLHHGADIHAVSEDSLSVLHSVADTVIFDAVDVAALLLDSGANLHEVTEDGLTPLHIAAWNGLKGVTGLFVERGAALEARDRLDQRPADLARGETLAILDAARKGVLVTVSGSSTSPRQAPGGEESLMD